MTMQRNLEITSIYNNLLNLCNDPDNLFYYSDQRGLPVAGNRLYRIFQYRVIKYSDWLKPDALRARGIMFEIDPDTQEPIRLACYPMDKFFNLNENPLTMNLNPDDITLIMDKVDGSIISQYSDGGILRLKSNASIQSDVAYLAMNYLETQPELKQWLQDAESENLQVNMEFTSPNNKIVIHYEEPKLTILNVRDRLTGEYIPFDMLDLSTVEDYVVQCYDPSGDMKEWLDNVHNERNIEGYVCVCGDLMFKQKTDWYLNLHRVKDSFTNPKTIIMNILNNQIDDVRNMFKDDKFIIDTLDRYEEIVVKSVSDAISELNFYYTNNKGKDRKNYALAYNSKTHRDLFGVYMKLYGTSGDNIPELVLEFFKNHPEKLVPEQDKGTCLTF